MKKPAISIRYKILLLLTSLPLLTLSVYLVLALNIFEEDKIAYVFESSSRMSGTLASQVKTQLNGVLSTARPIFQDYLSKGKFSPVAESIFSGEFGFEAVMVFKPEAGQGNEPVARLEKVPQQATKLLDEAKSLMPLYFAEAEASARVVKAPFKDDRIFIFEKLSDEANKSATVFLVVIRLSEVAEMFRSSLSQKVFLVGQTGEVLFGPDGMVGQKIQTMVTPSVLKGVSSAVAQGAETVKAQDGTDSLVSFAKVGFGDLIVVSTVPKSQALSAVQVLIRKSVIFFVLLISLTVILSLFASSGLTQSLTQLFNATKKVAEGDFNIRVDVRSSDEVGTLADNFNIMAAEVARLLQQTAEKARMESELQTAKTVQDTLFPETRARIGNLSIAGYYEPASECGGDWWHYCEIGNKVFLWIGDATGHGAPAALITSAAKSASTIIERLNISPAKALELLNRSIYDVSKGRIMMTFFLASFDVETGELIYCNASHEAPFVLRKSETALKKKDLELLNEVNNPRLGQARDTSYQQTSINLNPGDAVFFYTDGISDVKNPNQETWGERAFIKALLSANIGGNTVDVAMDRFSKKLHDYRQGAPLVDDVTFFVVKNESLN